LLESMAPLWDDARAAVDVVFAGRATQQLAALLERVEARLQAQGFGETIAGCRRQRERAAVEIIDYAPQYAADFKRLNIAWLERYFYVEALDDQGAVRPARLDPRRCGGRSSSRAWTIDRRHVRADPRWRRQHQNCRRWPSRRNARAWASRGA
jgi:hypothetical protein